MKGKSFRKYSIKSPLRKEANSGGFGFSIRVNHPTVDYQKRVSKAGAYFVMARLRRFLFGLGRFSLSNPNVRKKQSTKSAFSYHREDSPALLPESEKFCQRLKTEENTEPDSCF